MFHWLKRTCFTNLEIDSQKNKLFLFMLFPLLVFAECNISFNTPLTSSTNLHFLSVYLLYYGLSLVLILFPSLEKAFKYIVLSGMLVLSAYQLWLFNDFPIVYQIMYINLALALIFLSGALILYIGLATAAFTTFGFFAWKDTFFPQVDIRLANIPIIFILQMTIVLWGVTKIGVRFRDYIHHNQTMKQLLQENEQQLLLIHEKNRSLAQYAKQVEQLAVLEERNRVARELHDTMGHTLTSMIAGLEVLKHTTEAPKIDSLLFAARKGLEDVRNHVHQTDHSQADEPLPESIKRLADEFAENANVTVPFHVAGDPLDLSPQHRLTLLRCAQESLTNAVRHGQANRIRIELSYEHTAVRLTIDDNGSGTDELVYGYGLHAMQTRIEALHGALQITTGNAQGMTLTCRVPVRSLPSASEIRLLLVEDHELIAESFRILLGMEADFHVVGLAGNGEEAIRKCEQEVPDVILMDIQMPVMDGIEATRQIKQRWPHVKVVILTTFQDIENAALAISLGAEGYLMKSVQPKYLAETIRIVHAGGTLISMETAKLLVEERAATHQAAPTVHDEGHMPSDELRGTLSPKEIEILTYMADGLKYKEIAQRMNYSEGTVKNYVSILYSKLSVENRMQAVKKAHEANLI
ncbi:MAG: DUF4077 domain-containing protein [Tumebacillaceae bacterium]